MMNIRNRVINRFNKYYFTYIIKYYSDSYKVYKSCKRFVDRFNGENNDNMETNGEFFVMKQILGHCKVVFDIGANQGNWTQLALSINRNLNIHCFEPSKYTFNKLRSRQFPSSVIVNNFGLSSVNSKRELFLFEDGSGLNSLYKRYGLEEEFNLKPQQRTEEIQLHTLTNYCNEKNISNIDFMKVDTEGHELEVFKGGIELFKNGQINAALFEYGGCNRDARVFLKDFFDFFKGLDYIFFKVYPNHIRLIKRYNQLLDNFVYKNFLLLKKDAPFKSKFILN